MNNHSADNEILSYINKHGIEDKDFTTHKKERKKRPLLEKKKRKLRKIIDLHGKTQDEAVPLLRKTFQECKRKGIDSILIIHGIGHSSNLVEGPILKGLVQAMLENELCNYVKDYKTALSRDGGEGATIVRLR